MPAAAPLTFAAGRSELFLNFVGTVRAELLSASTMRPLLPLSQPLSGDATLAQVVWPGHSRPLAAFGGANPVRVRVTLEPASRLYAFWAAEDSCGASHGFLGAGGPGAPDGVDSRGRC